MDIQPFAPHYGSGQSATATTASATTPISNANRQVLIENNGPGNLFFRIARLSDGAPKTTATAADFKVGPGKSRVITKPIGDSGDPLAFCHVSDSTANFNFITGNGFGTDTAGGPGSTVTATGSGANGAQQVEGNNAVGTTNTGNPILDGGLVVGSLPNYVAGSRGAMSLSAIGSQYATLIDTTTGAVPAVANAGDTDPGQNGQVVSGRNQNWNGSNWVRQRGTVVGAAAVLKPEATGGALMAKIISAASTNPTAVKASAAGVVGIDVYNSGAAVCFLKLYNKATAPVVGTDIPVKVIAIPAGAPREINRPLSEAFSVGLAYAITTGFADADTGAVAAGQVTGSIDYA